MTLVETNISAVPGKTHLAEHWIQADVPGVHLGLSLKPEIAQTPGLAGCRNQWEAGSSQGDNIKFRCVTEDAPGF